MDIKLQIEEIIEKNGSDFELSKLFKVYINEYKSSLPKLFESSQGKDFLVKHTKKLDSIIELMYKTILRRIFGNYIPMRSSIPIAIVGDVPSVIFSVNLPEVEEEFSLPSESKVFTNLSSGRKSRYSRF